MKCVFTAFPLSQKCFISGTESLSCTNTHSGDQPNIWTCAGIICLHAASLLIADTFHFSFFICDSSNTKSNKTVTNNAVSVRSFGINVISQFKPNLTLHPSSSRPGLLNASDPGYPWLADSWPATSLPVNSSSGGPNDLGNFGRGGENLGCWREKGFKSALFLYIQLYTVYITLLLKVGSEGSTSINRSFTGLSNGKQCVLVSRHILQSERMQRERQAKGWVVGWKDGPEQPFVKDRRSLTGADTDTSATALHHLPFTGRADHGSLRKGACSLLSTLPPFTVSFLWHHTRRHTEHCVSQK